MSKTPCHEKRLVRKAVRYSGNMVCHKVGSGESGDSLASPACVMTNSDNRTHMSRDENAFGGKKKTIFTIFFFRHYKGVHNSEKKSSLTEIFHSVLRYKKE